MWEVKLMVVALGILGWFVFGWLSGLLMRYEARKQGIPWNQELEGFAWVFFFFGPPGFAILVIGSLIYGYKVFVERTSLWPPRLYIRTNRMEWYVKNGPWQGGGRDY